MKRTHKFAALGNVQAVVDSSPDLTVAARRLGVDRSTLTRWMQSGKVQRPASAPQVAPVEIPTTVDGWKSGVLAAHTLTDTDRTLVDVAEGALGLARNSETPAFTRLSAMGRFAALVRQLNLDAKRLDAVSPVRHVAAPRARPSGDPRAFLMAVK